ncbi:hypothetical protein OR1_02502 [Geobacter sp. OR-1]|uniref:PilZ domain-containing protein n=1 Tax=Geobacter sp. OR-1 TaxID=1266765 RepID=UPI0005424451|nr:PilZ domain-containing protein [Geobacter sp. OR-1]GAM10214.1 hypothetical protein OR1_02502 [Geobacter sp. OR-1]
MEQFQAQLKTGRHILLTINTPCGFAMVEDAVIASASGRYIKVILPAATNPKMDHLPVGTKVSVAIETDTGGQLACNAVINNLDERPFIWIKVLDTLPAISKRRHQRISVNLPMYCSVITEDGSMTVIYDGKKDNGSYEPVDLSLSAGGFKLKTPFKVKDETIAIAVFFSADETEWMVPVFSKSVYSYPSNANNKFLTGFRFSMINSRDKKKIAHLVEEHLQPVTAGCKARKYPSCLLRMRNYSFKTSDMPVQGP